MKENPKFSDTTLEAFNKSLAKYETKQVALLPTLHLAKKEFGYISEEVMEYVATLLDLPTSKVEEVTRFYSMFKTKPIGKYHIQICTNIACNMSKARELCHDIEAELGLSKEITVTPDGKFSLEHMECIASCGTAPALLINETLYENMDFEKLKEVIEKW